jgi:hypothetical protein
MKNILLFCFLIISGSLQVRALDIQKIRADYVAAVRNSGKATQLCKDLEKIKNPEPLILAYLGSVQAIKAKHAWNPVSKMACLKQGFETLNMAVLKDPNQLEIRFLRFSLQFYVPAVLGYSKNLDTDKKKIIAILQHHNNTQSPQDDQMLKTIVRFMIDCKKCNTQEIEVLKKSIA